MEARELIAQCEAQVQELLKEAEKGHDWFHIQRVRTNALRLQAAEGGDLLALHLAALLHDVDDAKFNGGDEEAGSRLALQILKDLGAPEALQLKVADLVAHCSYKGGQADDNPGLELQILRDADRLDAIGAIGIARSFHYGGFKNQAIYDPQIPVRDKMSIEEYRRSISSTINHFYEKLLKLKDGMYTKKGREMAEGRHRYMETFLQQFLQEWSAEDA